MDHRIVWIHGIGQYSPGYSVEWENTFNRYFHFSHSNYVEVCWDTVFHPIGGIRGLEVDEVTIELTPQEQLAEAEVRKDLQTIVLARASALALSTVSARGRAEQITEWSEFAGIAADGRRGVLPAWLSQPDAFLGDFVKYLVSRRVRHAVKEKAKERLRPLVSSEYSTSLVAHSWGTVVAHETLLDLEAELPSLQSTNLVTLGSPLWLVRHFLDERSGRKPGNVANWVSIHARGDVIGSWLSPGFQVDKEFEVPNFGGGDAHGSYFVPGNEAVQRDIIVQTILR